MKISIVIFFIFSSMTWGANFPIGSRENCERLYSVELSTQKIDDYLSSSLSRVEKKPTKKEKFMACEPSAHCLKYHQIDLEELDELYYITESKDKKGRVTYRIGCKICHMGTLSCRCKKN